jgi:predicted O-linked N-acetylglucosamine transferase (SPINDLY family)
MASRTSAGFLKIADLEELCVSARFSRSHTRSIANNEEHYVQIAVSLSNRTRLDEAKSKAIAARDGALFDTALFTHHLEIAYWHVWDLHLQNKRADISLEL